MKGKMTVTWMRPSQRWCTLSF